MATKIADEYLAIQRRMRELKLTNDEGRIAGDWTPGRFVSRLSEARAFHTPVPMIGRQGPWTPAEDVSAAIHKQYPYVGEPHFHVCKSCLHVWVHQAQPMQSHDCPKCEAGPFTEGWGSYCSAHEAMVALKAQNEKDLQKAQPEVPK